HALVPAQGSGIEHDELAVIAGSSLAAKDLWIREIQDCRTLAGIRRTSRKFLKPDVVGEHDMIGKARAQFFNPQQNFKGKRTMADVEFACVELRENVVDVENDPGARQLGNQGCENQQVGDRMNMNHVVAVLPVFPSKQSDCAAKECKDPPKVIPFPPLIDETSLNS